MAVFLLVLWLFVPAAIWFASLGIAAITSPLLRVKGKAGVCQKCGYSLKGLAEPRQCPECGTPETSLAHIRSDPAVAGRTIVVLSVSPSVLSLILLLMFSTGSVFDWFSGVCITLVCITLASMLANFCVIATQPMRRALWIRIPATTLGACVAIWILLAGTSDTADYGFIAIYSAPYLSGAVSGATMLIALAGFPVARVLRHLVNTWE